MTTDNISEKLDRLESLVEHQQATIADLRETVTTQRSQLEALSARQMAAEHPMLVADGGNIRVIGTMDEPDGIGVLGYATGDGGIGVEGIGDEFGVMGFNEPDEETRGETDPSSGQGEVTHEGFTQQAVEELAGVLGMNNRANGVGVIGIDDTREGHGVFSAGDAYTQGDHDITGELRFDDGTPQLTAGPIAKGHTSADTEETRTVNVDAIEWDEESGFYRIELTDIEFDEQEAVALVSPSGDDIVGYTVSAAEGDMIVVFEDRGQWDFRFIVYDLPEESNGERTSP